MICGSGLVLFFIVETDEELYEPVGEAPIDVKVYICIYLSLNHKSLKFASLFCKVKCSNWKSKTSVKIP